MDSELRNSNEASHMDDILDDPLTSALDDFSQSLASPLTNQGTIAKNKVSTIKSDEKNADVFTSPVAKSDCSPTDQTTSSQYNISDNESRDKADSETQEESDIHIEERTHTNSFISSLHMWYHIGSSQQQLLKKVGTILLISILILCSGTFITYRIVVHHLITEQQETYQTYSFNPGHIISNAKFFDSSSMSVEQIQEKLSQLGSHCNGTNCLANKQFETHNWTASAGCRAYISPGMQSAAQIIGSAAQSCGINPKVLIVILQKEQGLVTATNPTDESYRIAMGLSCPDHSACNAQYYGFFNQVFGTAERFQYYKNHLSEYNYQVHRINAVRFSPNAACGTQDIYIENEATALLYTYTPYQPNQAALEQTGNSCSSWGNLNFAWIYRQWFGNTQ